MTSTEGPTTIDVTEESPAPPSEIRTPRRMPAWAIWTAALVGALLVLGASYSLGMRSTADERDTARASLADAVTSLTDAEEALEDTRARLVECAELGESAAALHQTAADFAAGWKEFGGYLDAWALTAVGSAEEASAVADLIDTETEMSNQVGELTATAAQVEADVAACSTT
jgi:hypothetical protein